MPKDAHPNKVGKPRPKRTSATPKKTAKAAPKALASASPATTRKVAVSKRRNADGGQTVKEAAPPAKPGKRADFGAPTDSFFEKQAPHLRAILVALREIVVESAPDAAASLKWGMPFYSIGGVMMCAVAGFRGHVNLMMAGPPDAFEDPEGRLEGEGKNNRRLKLHTLDELPRDAVRAWLRVAAGIARELASPGKKPATGKARGAC